MSAKDYRIDSIGRRFPLYRMTPEKFWAKLVRAGNGCWEFAGNRQGAGYGRLNYHKRKVLAHRLAWELMHGPIPDGKVVCHHCDNPPCCNPAHLYVGTQKDNVGDAVRRGRQFIPYRPDYM